MVELRGGGMVLVRGTRGGRPFETTLGSTPIWKHMRGSPMDEDWEEYESEIAGLVAKITVEIEAFDGPDLEGCDSDDSDTYNCVGEVDWEEFLESEVEGGRLNIWPE